jgi:hypothetical protein
MIIKGGGFPRIEYFDKAMESIEHVWRMSKCRDLVGYMRTIQGCMDLYGVCSGIRAVGGVLSRASGRPVPEDKIGATTNNGVFGRLCERVVLEIGSDLYAKTLSQRLV